MRDLTPRDLVVELLRTLDDALLGYGFPGQGDGVRLMPSIYNEGSYAELEQRLGEMREATRRSWWHTSMRYRWGKEVMRPVRLRKTRKGRIPELPPRSELLITGSAITGNLVLVKLYTWSERVDMTYVESGVDWLLTTMHDGDTTKLALPLEFLYRALGTERGGHGDQPRSRSDESVRTHVATSRSRGTHALSG